MMNSTSQNESKTCDDRQLIRRFSQEKDEDAFTQLVQRHGPMVLQVCRRTLGSQQDAEDAFQAVFMVLARKAGKVGWQKNLAKWLYSVAIRISLKANSQMQKRPPQSEMTTELVCELIDADKRSDEFPEEAEKALYEEIHQLPAKLQAPIILCSLEGLTRSAAAEALGVRETTLNGRMERARALLRKRLLKREIILPAAVLTGGLIPTAAEAGFSTSLIFSPAAVATNLTVGTAVSGQLGVSAVKLAQGELATMLMITKLKIVVATVAVAMSVGTGSLFMQGIGNGDEPADSSVQTSDISGIQQALEGRWLITGMWDNGQKVDLGDQENKITLSIKSGVVSYRSNKLKISYQLDESRRPVALDLTDLSSDKTQKAIIQVEGGQLKICLNEDFEGKRPTEFKSIKGTPNDLLIEAERETGEVESDATIAEAPQLVTEVEDLKADVLKKLLGEWPIVSVKDGGKVRELNSAKANKFVFTENSLTMFANGRAKNSLYMIDVRHTPHWIDLGGGEVMKGIFEISEGKLKFCLNEHPGEPRPDKFESAGGSSPNDLLMIARRTNPVSEMKNKLLGEWQIVTAKEGGNVRELEVGKTNQFIFRDEKHFEMITTWPKEGKELIRHTTGTYNIDLSQQPYALDLDLGKGEVLKAIFELSGDEFKFCVKYESGGSRPDKFESKSASSNDLLMTARRIKSSD